MTRARDIANLVDANGDIVAGALDNVPAGVGGSSGVDFDDNVKARFGTDNDLEIFHDGSNSWINDTGTGNLLIGGGNEVRITSPSAGEFMATFANNGAATLYHDNSAKLATTSTGISVTGRVTMSNQPAFRAFGNNQGAISSGEFTGYHSTNFNIGNHFSTSSGRFTAPVAGVYFLRCDFRSNQSQGSGNMFIDISVNASNTVCRHEEAGSSFNALHQTVAGLWYMNAGDYASILVGGGGSNFHPDNSSTDSFAGFLVG